MEEDKVSILGAGSWGSALAYLLAGKDIAVTLWDRDPALVAEIQTLGQNPKYLPDVDLGASVAAQQNLEDAVSGARWVIIALASDGVRQVMNDAAPFLESRAIVLSAVKGLDPETGETMSELIDAALADISYAGIAVLSGPNLARELARGVPSASVVASADPALARDAQRLLMTDSTFRVYTHTDVKGVELGGALKNVLAIGAGISDGLGFGDNTKAALMTRGLMEMTQIGVAAGGQALTFLGLSGVGDLMATAGSRLSRNYRVGLGLAQGQTVEQILGELHQAAEGIPTAHAAQVLSRRYNIQTPVFAAIEQIVNGQKPPSAAVSELMTRGAKEEFSF